MSTVKDVVQACKGLGGVLVQDMPSEVNAPFMQKMDELASQIDKDSGMAEGSEIDLNLSLSQAAEALFEDLKRIKNSLLLAAARS